MAAKGVQEENGIRCDSGKYSVKKHELHNGIKMLEWEFFRRQKETFWVLTELKVSRMEKFMGDVCLLAWSGVKIELLFFKLISESEIINLKFSIKSPDLTQKGKEMMEGCKGYRDQPKCNTKWISFILWFQPEFLCSADFFMTAFCQWDACEIIWESLKIWIKYEIRV